MNKLEIEKLHFAYDKTTPVIKGINLVLDDRKTAIIGQNGSGKTTFVKLLKGLLRPDSGRILLDGIDLKTLTVAQISKKIGLVFQNPDIKPDIGIRNPLTRLHRIVDQISNQRAEIDITYGQLRRAGCLVIHVDTVFLRKRNLGI